MRHPPFILIALLLVLLQAGVAVGAGPIWRGGEETNSGMQSKPTLTTGFFRIPLPRCLATRWENSAVSISPQYVSLTQTRQSPPSPIVASRYPLSRRETFLYFGNRARDKIFTDFENFYRRDVLANYGTLLLGAGVVANTKMDRHFQNWYQRHIRCSFTNEFSEFSKTFGEGKIFIPIVVTSACVYRFRQERFGFVDRRRPLGDFFDRTARGYAVGMPLLLATQITLGGNRPREGSSYWKPFSGEDHTASGHAFIGAIPFITAAHMSDGYLAKGIFYTLSIIPAWSRINDDAHFLSQSVLGWYIAYLSVRAISETEGMKPLPKGLTIFPVAESNGAVGIGFSYRR